MRKHKHKCKNNTWNKYCHYINRFSYACNHGVYILWFINNKHCACFFAAFINYWRNNINIAAFLLTCHVFSFKSFYYFRYNNCFSVIRSVRILNYNTHVIGNYYSKSALLACKLNIPIKSMAHILVFKIARNCNMPRKYISLV